MKPTIQTSSSKKSSVKSWPRPEAGVTLAAVSMIVDMGIQNRPDFVDQTGKKVPRKPVQQLAVLVDLLTQTHDWGGDIGTKQIRLPLYNTFEGQVLGHDFVVYKQEDGVVTFNPKSKMAKLTSACGATKELIANGHDVEALLGKALMVEVTEREYNGNFYHKIKGVMPVMKGLPIPKLESAPIIVSFETCTEEQAKLIRSDVRKQIMKANNYQGSVIQKVFVKMGFDENGIDAPPAKKQEVETPFDGIEEDCPF